MIISVLQSNYIPWKGYFDIIARSDVFVVYDEVQYTKNDWRNRNLIKTQNGTKWLTIPVKQDKLEQKINETIVSQNNWTKKHIGTLQANYAKAPYFKEYAFYFFDIYKSVNNNLSNINLSFIKTTCELLGIKTEIINSVTLDLKGDRQERLIDACEKLGGTTYLSGSNAKNYIDTQLFENKNINIEWMDYSGYKEYNQLYPPFNHYVSILDLIFNEGPNSRAYMKY